MEGRHEHGPQALLVRSPRHGARPPRGLLRSLLNRSVGVAALLLFCLAPWIPGCPSETGAHALREGAEKLLTVETPRHALLEIEKAPTAKLKLEEVFQETCFRVIVGSLLGVVLGGLALALLPRRFAPAAATLGAGSALALTWLGVGCAIGSHFTKDDLPPLLCLAWAAAPIALTIATLARVLAERGLYLARALAVLALALPVVPGMLCWGGRATTFILGCALWISVAPTWRASRPSAEP